MACTCARALAHPAALWWHVLYKKCRYHACFRGRPMFSIALQNAQCRCSFEVHCNVAGTKRKEAQKRARKFASSIYLAATMDITINTPALLFPAISLVMLAYTNRFLALANVVRHLHDRYVKQSDESKRITHAQLKNLRFRLRIIKYMQLLGVVSFLLSIISMFLIYNQNMSGARWFFALSLLSFMASLVFSLVELLESTKSLEIELSDMEDPEDPGFLDYIRKKWQGE